MAAFFTALFLFYEGTSTVWGATPYCFMIQSSQMKCFPMVVVGLVEHDNVWASLEEKSDGLTHSRPSVPMTSHNKLTLTFLLLGCCDKLMLTFSQAVSYVSGVNLTLFSKFLLGLGKF